MTIPEIINFSLLYIVLGIGMVRFKKLTIPFKILTFSIVAILLLDTLSKISARLYKTNVTVLHVECLVLYMFYSAIYYYLFPKRTMKKAIFISTIVIIIFAFFNALILQRPEHNTFPSFLYIITNTALVLFSLLLFKQMLLYPIKMKITSQSVFWYNTSMLFFSTTMFLLLGIINYYARPGHADPAIYYFWYSNYYVLYILTGVALLMDNKEKTGNHA